MIRIQALYSLGFRLNKGIVNVGHVGIYANDALRFIV
jgi:hypothetical protein